MKILVTGGAGFVGSYLVEDLARNGDDEVLIYDIARPAFPLPDNVRWIDGDICYKTTLDKYISGCEEVYDCAGLLGTHELVYMTERAIDTNIKGAFNVLQSCLDFNVKRLFHPTKPCFSHQWENTYTITKLTAENFCRMYRDVYGMDITILRWMNASGPGQHLQPVRKFIPLAICLALLGKDIEVYGSGEQTVDIIDVRDLSQIVIRAVRGGLGRQDEVWDVGTGRPLSCLEVAEYVIEKTGSRSKVVFAPMRVGEAKVSNVYARSHEELLQLIDYELAYEPHRTLDDCIDYYRGLERAELEGTLEYYLKNGLYSSGRGGAGVGG